MKITSGLIKRLVREAIREQEEQHKNYDRTVNESVPRGGMEMGQVYIQDLSDMTLYFKPVSETNKGVKGILYTVYPRGRTIAGKNPKSIHVDTGDMDLWAVANQLPGKVKAKLGISESIARLVREAIREQEEQQQEEYKYSLNFILWFIGTTLNRVKHPIYGDHKLTAEQWNTKAPERYKQRVINSIDKAFRQGYLDRTHLKQHS